MSKKLEVLLILYLKNINQMTDINLIRGIAWSFAKSTGIEYAELFSEASLAYLEAKLTHNPNEATLSTWAYTCMESSLLDFIKGQKKHNYDIIALEDCLQGPSVTMKPFFELAELFSDNASILLEKVLTSPYEYLNTTPKRARSKLVRVLREEGYSWSQIRLGMREIKLVLAEN